MTLTFTTSRRPELFLTTIRSMALKCLDLEMVRSIVIFDDASPGWDRSLMMSSAKTFFPGREVLIFTKPWIRGHAQIMQDWHSRLSGEFLFHCEDDWEFTTRGCPILSALDVMLCRPDVGQVSFSREAPLSEVDRTPGGTDYWVWFYSGAKRSEDGIHYTWPRFTLNPGVFRVSELMRVGNFDAVKEFEFSYGLRWCESGIQTAYLRQPFVRHIGSDNSAYALNCSER